MNNVNFITTKTARKLLGVTTQTLRNWGDSGKINIIRAPSGVRLYDRKDVQNLLSDGITAFEKKKIAYCRVSSKKQMDDLERQKDFFRYNYPNHILVADIGPGINWKRKGLKTILEQALCGDISEIVVAHRDRLCRFAFELLEWILAERGVKLIVLDREVEQSDDKELADDILSIIHVYSCKRMGRRRYKVKEDKIVPESESEEDNDKLDRNQ